MSKYRWYMDCWYGRNCLGILELTSSFPACDTASRGTSEENRELSSRHAGLDLKRYEFLDVINIYLLELGIISIVHNPTEQKCPE